MARQQDVLLVVLVLSLSVYGAAQTSQAHGPCGDQRRAGDR